MKPLVRAVRTGLLERRDPVRALGMQAYMKSKMPYLGLYTVQVRAVCRDAFAAHPLFGFHEWQETVLDLWNEATFREERYVAIELTGDRRYRVHQTPAAIPLYEELVVTGAWWDYVDPIATSRLRSMLQAHRAKLTPVLRSWSTDEHLWKRRTSIICQVGAKADTDLDLLYACIEPNLADRDLFIRKAIGWALREYAKTDPAEVTRYVAAHHDRLSGLSKREALKHAR